MDYQRFDIPSSIEVYINPKKNDYITRDVDNFVDITKLRRGKGMHKISNFIKTQAKYLEQIEKEIGENPIRNGEKRRTLVHEKILERILRWYDADELTVIDKFVHPNNREIGVYKYDVVQIMIHLDSKYINASQLCAIFETSIHRWCELESTQKLFKLYCNMELKYTIDDPMSVIIKKGLGYDSNEVWIPHDLLPMLAIWCSPEYALFASKLMNLFHTDPLKAAALSIQEHDRRTGNKTTAFFKSANSNEEHIANLQEQHAQVVKNVLDNNSVIIDENGKEITLDEYKVRYTKQILKLNNEIHLLSERTKILEMDSFSMRERFKPVIELINDHGEGVIMNAMVTTKDKMDKAILPLELEISNSHAIIKTLQDQIQHERTEKEYAYNELSIVNGTHEEEMRDKDEYIDQLETTHKKKTKKQLQHKELISNSRELCINSIATPNSCSSLSVYTKRSYDGNHFAIVPGRSNNFKDLGFIYRGMIGMDEKYKAEHYLKSFAANNKHIYKSYTPFTFILGDYNIETFEKAFTDYFNSAVIVKTDIHGYTIKDNICSY